MQPYHPTLTFHLLPDTQLMQEVTISAFRAHESFHKKMVDSALAALTQEEEELFVSALGKIKDFFDKESKQLNAVEA